MRTAPAWRWALPVVAAALVPLLLAADHRDGPAVTSDPAADLTDLYAWMSADGARVNLVLDVFPDAGATATFSDAVQYVFHVSSRAGATPGAGTDTNVVCTFDANQVASCWVGDAAYVTGDASATAGIANDDGSLRVFAGRRNDPFFFNLDGFKKTAATVTAASSSLTFDANGCPAIDASTAAVLIGQLGKDDDGTAATDDFAGQSVLSLVVSVDKTLLTAGGPILAVWASTNAKP